MNGTEEIVQDQTRGKGESFSAGECGTLEAALRLSQQVLEARAKLGAGVDDEERAYIDALTAKCKRGAGL